MLKFNYFNADKTPFKQRLNESDERERKTSKNVLFVLENCTFRFADYTGFEEIEALATVDAMRRAEMNVVNVAVADTKKCERGHGPDGRGRLSVV